MVLVEKHIIMLMHTYNCGSKYQAHRIMNRNGKKLNGYSLPFERSIWYLYIPAIILPNHMCITC